MSKLKWIAGLVLACTVVTVSAHTILTEREIEGAWEPRGYSPIDSLVEQQPLWQVYSGVSWVDFLGSTNDTTIQISNIETDTLAQSNKSDTVGFLFGINRLFTYANADWTKVRAISFGGSLQLASTTMTGQVYQFQNPTLNNFTYSYKASPIDLLSEITMYITRVQNMHMMPYFVVGGGFSIVDLNYSEAVQPGINPGLNRPLTLSGTEVTPAVIGGIGLQFNIEPNYLFKIQYLYHYRGTATLDTKVFLGSVPINLNEQSVDFMLGMQFV